MSRSSVRPPLKHNLSRLLISASSVWYSPLGPIAFELPTIDSPLTFTQSSPEFTRCIEILPPSHGNAVSSNVLHGKESTQFLRVTIRYVMRLVPQSSAYWLLIVYMLRDCSYHSFLHSHPAKIRQQESSNLHLPRYPPSHRRHNPHPLRTSPTPPIPILP